MGRFDALTQIEEKPQAKNPSPESRSPIVKKSQLQEVKKPNADGKKPEIMKTRKPETLSPTESLTEKPEKYSTLLKRSLVKRIKNDATDMDIDDYEVLERALIEYFEKQK